MKERLHSLNTYLWNTGNALSELRLIVEGAIVLYEDDALPLTRLANKHGENTAACAFDTIGAALYELRKIICTMQQDHMTEVLRQSSDGATTDMGTE